MVRRSLGGSSTRLWVAARTLAPRRSGVALRPRPLVPTLSDWTAGSPRWTSPGSFFDQGSNLAVRTRQSS
jgi:hypothetical protein